MTHSEEPGTPTPVDYIAHHLKSGRRKKAEKVARAALAETPHDPEVLTLLAGICTEDGRLAEAEQHLIEAGRLRSHHPQGYLNLAQFYVGAARFGDAETVLREAIERLPKAFRLWLELGQLLQRLGRFAEAETAFTTATDLNPEAPLPLLHLGMVLNRLDRLEEAANAFHKAIALAPDLAAAYGNLGNVELRRGNLEAATQAFEKATELEPQNGQAQASYGLAKLRLGDIDAAIAIFESTLERLGPERRAAAWLPIARAQAFGNMPLGARAELGRHISRHSLGAADELAELNRSLAAYINEHPTLVSDAAGKPTRGGAETGYLIEQNKPPLNPWLSRLVPLIDHYFASLKPEAKHPFLGRVPDRYQLDIWGAVVRGGGFQVPHLQAGAWMSGLYFAAVPAGVTSGDEDEKGWVDFGHPPEDVPISFDPKPIPYAPKMGDALFFPSYAFRRLRPLPHGEEPMVLINFNVRPISWRS